MAELRLHYSTGPETEIIAESWRKTTYDKYCALLNAGDTNKIENRIAAMTGMSPENVMNLTGDQVLLIGGMLSYLDDASELIKANTVPEKYKNFDIGALPWGLLCEAKNAYVETQKAGLNIFSAGAKIVEIYTRIKGNGYPDVPGWKIGNESIIDVFGLVNFFLTRSQPLFNDMPA